VGLHPRSYRIMFKVAMSFTNTACDTSAVSLRTQRIRLNSWWQSIDT